MAAGVRSSRRSRGGKGPQREGLLALPLDCDVGGGGMLVLSALVGAVLVAPTPCEGVLAKGDWGVALDVECDTSTEVMTCTWVAAVAVDCD